MKREDIWHFARLGICALVFIGVIYFLCRDFSWELTAFNLWISGSFTCLLTILGITIKNYLQNEKTWKKNIK